jgi:PAS domain S-box-containing protein
MKFPFSLGLRGRLILLLLAAFAALFGLLVLHAQDIHKEWLRSIEKQLLTDAKLIAARQQSIAMQADAVLNGLMLRPELRPGAAVDLCEQFLAEQLKQEPEFNQIGKLLPDGELACAAAPASPPLVRVNAADRHWFQAALQVREMVVSDIQTSTTLGQPTFIFTRAMVDATGRVAGVITLERDLSWLHRELAAARLPEGSRLMVIDQRGVVAQHHSADPDSHIGRNVDCPSAIAEIVEKGGEGILETTDLDGLPLYIAYTPLLDTSFGQLHLLLISPVTEMAAPVQRHMWAYLAVVLVVFVLMLLAVVWGGNRMLISPLLRLSRMALRIGVGEHGVRSGLPHTDDEIGGLARTIDKMADSIEEQERRLDRANRALRVLSAGNRTLLRAGSEQALTEDMCRVIVEAGDYCQAWVGYVESDQRVRLVASWGAREDFLDSLNVTWDESAAGCGPTGTAIRSGIAVACNNVERDQDYEPWRERARQYGYASSLALPLMQDGIVMGVLNIYAVETDVFDKEVIELLTEAANDLAYGIVMRRAAVEHKRTETELQRLERQNTLILASAGVGIFGLDLEGRVTFINPAAVEMLQWPEEELVGQVMHSLSHHTKADGMPYPHEECLICTAYLHGVVHRVTDEVFWRKDGSCFPVEYISTPLRDGQGELTGAVAY